MKSRRVHCSSRRGSLSRPRRMRPSERRLFRVLYRQQSTPRPTDIGAGPRDVRFTPKSGH